MKLKYLLTSLFVVFLFLANAPKAFAACEINIVKFDEGTRNLEVCIGGFRTIEELKATTVQFNCLDNSNLNSTGCRGREGQYFSGLEPVDISLSGTDNTNIVSAPNGYYTCPIITEINRAIGKANLSVTGNNGCSSDIVTIKPGNWNIITEGSLFGNILQAVGVPTPTNISEGAAYCITSDGARGVKSALGCISFDATGGGFVRSLLGVIIGLGGGVALLLILYGIFIVTTSAGIPEKLKEGKELITSAIAGLLFIIMAIFLMNLIGIQLLALPGLK